MKRSVLTVAMGVMAMALWVNVASAEDKEAKTVSGTSGCATCEGIVSEGSHPIMLTDADGKVWVLMGSSEDYKKAHGVRKDGKKMTATLDGEPETKKSDDGKEYMVAKISKIEVES